MKQNIVLLEHLAFIKKTDVLEKLKLVTKVGFVAFSNEYCGHLLN